MEDFRLYSNLNHILFVGCKVKSVCFSYKIAIYPEIKRLDADERNANDKRKMMLDNIREETDYRFKEEYRVCGWKESVRRTER